MATEAGSARLCLAAVGSWKNGLKFEELSKYAETDKRSKTKVNIGSDFSRWRICNLKECLDFTRDFIQTCRASFQQVS